MLLLPCDRLVLPSVSSSYPTAAVLPASKAGALPSPLPSGATHSAGRPASASALCAADMACVAARNGETAACCGQLRVLGPAAVAITTNAGAAGRSHGDWVLRLSAGLSGEEAPERAAARAPVVVLLDGTAALKP